MWHRTIRQFFSLAQMYRNRRTLSTLTMLLWIALIFFSSSIYPHEHDSNSDGVFVNTETIIRRIDIIVQDVFDPDSNFLLAQVANMLHLRTRNQTIRQELLFHEYEVFDQRRLDETERNLRALGFFANVEIQTQAVSPESVDVLVLTRDKWSTRLTSSYRLEGGVQYFGLGLIEDNVVGLGKTIDFSYNQSSEEILRQVQWNDPNVFGSRLTNRLKYQNNSDARLTHIGFARPFYSWRSRWGFKFDYQRTEGIYKQHQKGDVTEYDMKDRFAQLTTSFYWGHRVKRHLMLGAIQEKFRVGERQRNYNLIGTGFGWMERNYLKARHIDSFDIIEDLPHGYRIEIAAAVNYQEQNKTFHKPYLFYRLAWAKASQDDFSLYLDSRLQTFFDLNHTVDLFSENEIKVFKSFSNQLWLARFLWTMVKNPATYNHLTLGDENGLRGFPLHSRAGAKMLLANLESRIRTRMKFYFLRLGFTIFMDLGEVWDTYQPVNLKQLKSSVGLGLRVGNEKYSSGITRIDFAYNTCERVWRISVSARSYFSAYLPLEFMNDFKLDKLR